MRSHQLFVRWKVTFFIFTFVMLISLNGISRAQSNYPVVDTGQQTCYNATVAISPPNPGDPFYGQDAQYQGIQFAYQDNNDGTVTDLNTGLMWQQMPYLYDKPTYQEAVAGADTFSLAGYNDWRLPSIKELYSLIDFTGSSMTLTAYIDTNYFGFRFGDTSLGERVIDGQYWSSTEYVGTTMNNDPTVFGVNFADGRIKGYPRDTGPGGQPNRQFARYVRGSLNYGINDFVDNGDGTISDLATGLMWQQGDSGDTLNWEQALAYAENLVLADCDDWRLPNAKELQSIVDYTRAPDATNPAQQGPAIDTSFFDVSEVESWFWSSTTLLEAPPNLGYGSHAAYFTFGQAFGYMGPPGMGEWLNVHGAGAQRSDPKSGDPSAYPYGFGPQGDQIRIYNYVRCVRDVGVSHSSIDSLIITMLGVNIILSWEDIPNADGYNVYADFHPNVVPDSTTFIASTTNNSYADRNVISPNGTPAKFYCVTVELQDDNALLQRNDRR